MHLRTIVGAGLLAATLIGCSSAPRQSDPGTIGSRAAQHALDMQGKPYRYGGNTPRGFDCSGLVQYSYSLAGIDLPRSTEGLWKYSSAIATRNLQPGDLLFFNQEGKRSSHVAIYVGRERFVHAPSTGKRVSIGNLDSAYWRRHLESVRRPFIQ
ncbi:MAG TPA: C40 family peptidase [Burkholderiales bacterium]